MNNENNTFGNQIPANNQPINNQSINNSQFMNQSFQQPQQQVNYQQVQPQINNVQPQQQVQSQMNNQVNYQQPMNNAQINIPPQMTNNFNQYPNQKRSNKKLFIIIGICVVVAIAIIVLLIALLGNDKNENKNEYENNNNINNNTSNEQTNTTSSTDIQNYKGFNFKKISGYNYVIKDDILIIGNDEYGFILTITSSNFNSFKANYQTNISNDLKNIITGQTKLESYSNIEVATYEVSMNGNNAVYFILSTPNQSYSFEGYVMTKDNTFNYSGINELIKLTSNAEYTGNFTNYSSDFGMNVDVKNLIEN